MKLREARETILHEDVVCELREPVSELVRSVSAYLWGLMR